MGIEGEGSEQLLSCLGINPTIVDIHFSQSGVIVLDSLEDFINRLFFGFLINKENYY